MPPKLKALQDILDQYLPDRKRTPENTLSNLLDEMESFNFTLETLVEYLETKLNKLLKIEAEVFLEVRDSAAVESRWWQIGIVRGFMYLTIDAYWHKHGTQDSDHFVSIIQSYRPGF